MRIRMCLESLLVGLYSKRAHPSFVMANTVSDQTPARMDLWRNRDLFEVIIYTRLEHGDSA